MSEFYKRKRNLILKDYKYLGMKEKISFYSCRFCMIFIIYILCGYLIKWIKSENIGECLWAILILGLCTLFFYFFSKSDSKKQQKDKMNAVSRFIKEPDINTETVDALIKEIESHNKKMRTFATWIVGLSATFIILLLTLGTNFFMKVFDVYLKATPADELSKMLESINQNGYMNDNILIYLDLGFTLLIIFIMVILIIYSIFTIFFFVKEQILIFLFDVKYELLLSSNRENINKSDEVQTKNT